MYTHLGEVAPVVADRGYVISSFSHRNIGSLYDIIDEATSSLFPIKIIIGNYIQ